MYKRGQITLFVIIGIVVVSLIIGTVLVTNQSINPLRSKYSKELQIIDATMNDCVKQQSLSALWLLGIQGGYVNTPDEYIASPFGNIAYGIKDTKTTLPSLDSIEQEIEEELTSAIPYCINPLDYQTDISITNPTNKVTIKKNAVIVESTVEITATENGTTQIIKKTFKDEIPIRLGEIHQLATDIINRQQLDLTTIPISFLSGIETQILFEYYDDRTIYYIIHDEKSEINNVVYNFLFAVELEEPNES